MRSLDIKDNVAPSCHLKTQVLFPVSVFPGLLEPHLRTHHHASCHSNAPATVGVGYDVPIAHTQESDSYQPHCVEQIRVFFIVISVRVRVRVRVRRIYRILVYVVRTEKNDV